jgi:hypothetical protein
MIILAPLSALFILAVLIKLAAPYIAVVAVLAVILLSWIDEQKQKIQQKLEVIRLNVRLTLFYVLCEIGELLPIKRMNTDDEISSTVMQSPHTVVSVRVLKSGDPAPEDIERIKAQIQVTINKHLREGKACGFPNFTYDTAVTDIRDSIPALTAISVTDCGIELEINILVADNPSAIAYVRSLRNPPPDNAAGLDGDKDF